MLATTPPSAYDGPPELLDAVVRALSWVTNPQTGRGVLEERRVRTARIGAGTAVVHLAMRESPIACVVVEDVEAELFDHLAGRWPVRVILLQQPLLRLA